MINLPSFLVFALLETFQSSSEPPKQFVNFILNTETKNEGKLPYRDSYSGMEHAFFILSEPFQLSLLIILSPLPSNLHL